METYLAVRLKAAGTDVPQFVQFPGTRPVVEVPAAASGPGSVR
jgi:hypothetical protein